MFRDIQLRFQEPIPDNYVSSKWMSHRSDDDSVIRRRLADTVTYSSIKRRRLTFLLMYYC